MLAQNANRARKSVVRHEIKTTTAIENRPALTGKAGNVPHVDAATAVAAPKFLVQKSLVTVSNTNYAIAVFIARANDRSQARIHTRRVPAATQNAYLQLFGLLVSSKGNRCNTKDAAASATPSLIDSIQIDLLQNYMNILRF